MGISIDIKKKNLIVNFICYLYIVLFVYASVSKILEFQDFQTQLGQSPVLGAFAVPISYGIILIEIMVSMLLIFEKSRLTGFYLSFLLMVLFTAYIVIILNFTSFTPCSCGGVLEDLGWTEHLIFNVGFILLAIFALVCLGNNIRPIIFKITGLFLFGISVVVVLYGLSEKEIKRNNAFQRKYIPHGLEELGSFPLESNAFYIAGIDDQNIYLGNYNAPLYLKVIGRNLESSEFIKIKIEDYNIPFKRIKINVHTPYFFMGDGTVPVLFRGKTSDWKGKVFSKGEAYFYDFQVLDSNQILISTTRTKSQANVLGILRKRNNTVDLILSDSILKSQIDGTFDTDGDLLWNNLKNQIVFVYYYRNQFEVADNRLSFLFTGKTIDTVSHAQIEVGHYKKENVYKLGRSTLVNKTASVWGNHLYINSERLGKYEKENVLKSAGIIDVYNLNRNEYLHSFYFYHQRDQKLKEFRVIKDTIIAIVEDQLCIQKIKPEYFDD